jgi:hypothetical protein
VNRTQLRRVESTISIYALCDPRSGSIKYVGKTFDPLYRLQQHLWPCHVARTTPKAIWLRALVAQGLKPELVVLQTVPTPEWGTAERRWIEHLRAEGHNLLNGTSGGPGGYAESRWQRQRTKGPVARNTASGVLGVVHTRTRRNNGKTYEYWAGHVTLNSKTWSQNFPYTDAGKAQAAAWYETAKQQIEAGYTPEVNKRHAPPHSGVTGLVAVHKHGEMHWAARVQQDGRLRWASFPYTDAGKRQALVWLAKHANGDGLPPPRHTSRRPSGVKGVYYQRSESNAYWAGVLETPARTYVQTFPYTDEGKQRAGTWYQEGLARLDRGLIPVIVKHQPTLSGVPGLGHLGKRGKEYWKANLHSGGKHIASRTFPFTNEGRAEAIAYLEHLRAQLAP